MDESSAFDFEPNVGEIKSTFERIARERSVVDAMVKQSCNLCKGVPWFGLEARDDEVIRELNRLPESQVHKELLHYTYHCKERPDWLSSVLVSLIVSTMSSQSTQRMALTCLGSVYASTSAADILELLRSIIYNNEIVNSVRERAYFGYLMVRDLPPFPEEKLRQWSKLHVDFRFPDDVDWSKLF